MHVVTVLPLERNSRRERLTYFSSQEIHCGDVVVVPIRSKAIHAIVEDVRTVEQEKASIKSSKIGMRKVTRVLTEQPFSKNFIRAAEQTATFHAVGTGAVISSVTPITFFKHLPTATTEIETKSPQGTYVVQTGDEERLSQYRSLIRESFRHGESVFVLAPTIQDVETISGTLAKGISEYALMLHSGHSAAKIVKSVTAIHTATHPLLIIGTPGFLAYIPANTGTIIVERENSLSYKQMVWPYIDFRFFAHVFAKIAKKRLVLGDLLLSTETIARYEEDNFFDLIPVQWRTQSNAISELIPILSHKPDLRGKFTAISEPLYALIEQMRSASENTFIFSGRKGLSPITICGDCGSLLLCEVCTAPLVLHISKNNVRWYLCHRCGNQKDATLRCNTCTSWKLVTMGIGTELVEKELERHIKGIKLFRLDRDTAKDRRKVTAIAEQFYKTPGAVLIGTELAVPYLDTTIGATAIASIDELFSIPDFRINERALYLLLKIKSMAGRKFLVQTRHPENPVIVAAIEGNTALFYQQEIALRKALHYPPFFILIKITVTGTQSATTQQFQDIAERIKPYTISLFPVATRKPSGDIVHTGVIKIQRLEWPVESIVSLLKSLSRSIEIKIDPDSLL